MWSCSPPAPRPPEPDTPQRFPCRDIANPAPLGFFSFSIALAIFACVKANIVEVTSALLVIPAGYGCERWALSLRTCFMSG